MIIKDSNYVRKTKSANLAPYWNIIIDIKLICSIIERKVLKNTWKISISTS